MRCACLPLILLYCGVELGRQVVPSMIEAVWTSRCSVLSNRLLHICIWHVCTLAYLKMLNESGEERIWKILTRKAPRVGANSSSVFAFDMDYK